MKFARVRILKISSFFLFLFLLHVLVSYLIIQETTAHDIRQSLQMLNERVRHDLRYENGKWDTALYNSDPFTAYPNSSSAFPLYIVTTDGFVIERSKPIHGLLDSSDYRHLTQFETPQMINTITNEQWRVVSLPIQRNGQVYGVVLASSYNPQPEQLDKVDQQLQESVQKLQETVEIKNGELDASKIDVRNIHYSVSFEVVSKFNKVLVNDGRTPSFIDTSYIQDELAKPAFLRVKDAVTQEEFLTYRQPILDQQNQVVAVVVVGRSIQSATRTLQIYLLSSLAVGILLTIPLSIMLVISLREELGVLLSAYERERLQATQPQRIRFDKKRSVIFINDKEYEIAYASNQYYLCKMLFAAPQKRWEQDQLLEAFGEDISGEANRKIYDAALAVNKKIQVKLIVYQDKTYFIAPEFVPLLKNE